MVQDAKNALVSSHGGKFEILNSIFDKNYIGIVVKSWHGSSQRKITETTFDCTGTLLSKIIAQLKYDLATHNA